MCYYEGSMDSNVIWTGLNIPTRSANAILHAFRGIYRGSTKKHKRALSIVAASIYHIWEMRNNKIFQDRATDINDVVRVIKITIHSLHELQSTSCNRSF